MRIFQYGNKAALIVGVILMIADSFVPLARQFGAWEVGCLFCVWYSASAIREDERLAKHQKKWFYVYLVIVFLFAILLHGSADHPLRRTAWTVQSTLKSMGIGSK